MRNFSYWLCFTLVAFASLSTYALWLLSTLKVSVPFSTVLSLFMMFGTITPQMLAIFLPRVLLRLIDLAVFLLVVHRMYLLLSGRRGIPPSYAGLSKFLGYVGATSFVLCIIALILTILLKAGSGVPAGMLLLPAVLCVPWAFFLSEILSFRTREVAV